VVSITLKDALNIEPKLKELHDTDPTIRELIDVAQRLEGLTRHASTHAAGVVISPEPLTEFLPLYKAPNEEVITTQFDMESIEILGLLKFDFLGLKTLTVIDKTEKIINQSTGEPSPHRSPAQFSVKNIPLDDSDTFRLFCAAKTTGVFQLESTGMRDLLLRLEPGRFEDLIALVALFRPGPLGSGMIDDFIKRKRGEVSIKYQLPQLEEILKETYGIILYQEQVMKITNVLANFSMADADILQRALSKKKLDQMEKLKDTFLSGAKSNKISERKALKLFNDMANFAQYGFNKSHSAAYALIAYQTAYLKTHHPVEFMAALLSSDMDNTTKVVSYINECKDMGIEILPPDINQSEQEFNVIGNSIRFGLEAVKGVGSTALESIIDTRRIGKFESFFDFCSRIDSRKVNKKVIESLIKAGAFDSMGKRAQLMYVLGSAMDFAFKAQKERSSGQRSMFETHATPHPQLPDVEEWNESERLIMEKDALGFYITGHPLNKYKDRLRQLSVTPSHAIQDLPDKEDVNVGGIPIKLRKIQTKKKGDLMAYLTIEDLYGTTELIVFPDLYRESETVLTQDIPLIIYGHIDKSDKGLKIIARKIASIEGAQPEDANGHISEAGPDTVRPDFTTRTTNRRRAAHSHSTPEMQLNGSRTVSITGESSKRRRMFTVTLYADTDSENLSNLKNIISRHGGDPTVPVYLKIVSPKHWETLIKTDQQVSPSEEMISEVENILGKGKALLS
jgi:DNA polymerase-3 subunit alpha